MNISLIVESNDQTEPFFVHHLELNGVKKVRTPNSYGKYSNDLREVIDVYVDDKRSPYYIWTKYGYGKTKVEELKTKFEGKWVVADVMFSSSRDRIRGVKWKIVDEPTQNREQPTTHEEPPTVNKSEQLEFDFFKETKNKKQTLTFSQLKQLVTEEFDGND